MKILARKGFWISEKGKRTVGKINRDDVKSVAVIRHAALGDMILTRNFLIELKRFFPTAKITFSISSNYQSGVPKDLADDIHLLDVSEKVKGNTFALVKNAKQLGYHDIIFDLAATTRSMMICRVNSAKLKIGFPYRNIQRKIFYDAAIPRSDLNFEVDDMLNMLRLFGHSPQYPKVYNLPGKATQRDKQFVLYFTSASEKTKCWAEERFIKLLKLMSAEYSSLDHLVLEGKADWEKTDNIINECRGAENIKPVNANSVEEVISLVKGAKLVISNDTSVRNIAIAAAVPTVGIFFATPPYRYLPDEEKHAAVFNADGDMPKAEEVFNSAKILLH